MLMTPLWEVRMVEIMVQFGNGIEDGEIGMDMTAQWGGNVSYGARYTA